MKKGNIYVACVNILLFVIMAVIQWFVWNLSTFDGYGALYHIMFKVMIGIVVLAFVSFYAMVKYRQFQYSLAVIPCMGAFLSVFNYYDNVLSIVGDGSIEPIQIFIGITYGISLIFAIIVFIMECKYPNVIERYFMIQWKENIASILLYILALWCFSMSMERIYQGGIETHNIMPLFISCSMIFTATLFNRKSSKD